MQGMEQYDESVKQVLAHKIILANILVNTVKDFKGMKPEEVEKLIEGEPYISSVPVEPGMTNKKNANQKRHEKIVGMNTEDIETAEGWCVLIFFLCPDKRRFIADYCKYRSAER